MSLLWRNCELFYLALKKISFNFLYYVIYVEMVSSLNLSFYIIIYNEQCGNQYVVVCTSIMTKFKPLGFALDFYLTLNTQKIYPVPAHGPNQYVT
jgi:hypothetical protein